jgi:hypothetical protein
MNIKAPGPLSMGASMTQWFIFTLLVSVVVAYVASGSIPWGSPYRHVFRVVGTVAFLAYGAGQIPAAIWMGKPWSIAVKELIDAVIYGAITAGTFGWRWPRGI